MEQLSGGQLVFLFLVLAWLVIVVAGMLTGMRKREHAHRERLAMIEKGLLPPPEMYPNRYDAPPWAQGPSQTYGPHMHPWRRDLRAPYPRLVARKLGVMILCAAGGIGWLLFVLGQSKIAVALGGLIGMMGVAFVIISFNLGVSMGDAYRGEPGPSGPPEPPGPPAV